MSLKFSHCIDMMYSYTDFEDRITEAKRFGADAIEFWKWSNKDVDRLAECGMPISIFNLDCKNEALSYDLSRGILNSGRVEDFLYALEESIPVYKKLSASAMIVLIGENAEPNAENVAKCLEKAKPIVEAEGVHLIVEPLNSIDRVGYSMPYVTPVLDILRSVDSPNIKLLYDIYHQNMMGDFDIEEVCRSIDLIGHFHVADFPGRHQPGTGRGDYVGILKRISTLSYNGYIGLEYRATIPDGETFGFIDEVRKNA